MVSRSLGSFCRIKLRAELNAYDRITLATKNPTTLRWSLQSSACAKSFLQTEKLNTAMHSVLPEYAAGNMC